MEFPIIIINIEQLWLMLVVYNFFTN